MMYKYILTLLLTLAISQTHSSDSDDDFSHEISLQQSARVIHNSSIRVEQITRCLAEIIKQRRHCPSTDLHHAVKNRNVIEIKRLMATTVNTYATNEDGDTPLIMESKNTEQGTEIMEALLNTTCPNIDSRDDQGFPALYHTIRTGLKDKTELLLTKGARISQICNGMTPLSFAAMNNNKSMVQLLVQKGALENEPLTETVETSLQLAAAGNFSEIVEVLLSAGANPNQRFDIRQKTPLMYAVQNKNIPMAQNLIKKGADVNAVLGWKSSEGTTKEDAKINDWLFRQRALDLALKEESKEMIKLLKDRGASKTSSCSIM